MRSFELGRSFDLVIVPGHSFRFMLAIPDQLSCLHALRLHLAQNGRLVVHVDHQDLAWLGSLPAEVPGALDPKSEVRLPDSRAFRVTRRWFYDRATQTASAVMAHEELDDGRTVIDRAERVPVQLHCFFRYEMELLCRKAGFEIQTLYGDFMQSELGDKSTKMVWVLRVPAP